MNSTPIEEGHLLTLYGDRMVPTQDTFGTPQERYGKEGRKEEKRDDISSASRLIIILCYLATPPYIPTALEDPHGHVPKPKAGGAYMIGQMTNDGAALQIKSPWIPTLDNFGTLLKTYVTESLTKQNVRMEEDGDDGWRMYAGRSLVPGEELYFHYGHTYWLKPLMEESKDPVLILLILLYQVRQRVSVCWASFFNSLSHYPLIIYPLNVPLSSSLPVQTFP